MLVMAHCVEVGGWLSEDVGHVMEGAANTQVNGEKKKGKKSN